MLRRVHKSCSRVGDLGLRHSVLYLDFVVDVLAQLCDVVFYVVDVLIFYSSRHFPALSGPPILQTFPLLAEAISSVRASQHLELTFSPGETPL